MVSFFMRRVLNRYFYAMIASPAKTPTPLPRFEPEVRYSIRDLMTATTVLAIMAASLSPFFRAQTELGQRRLMFVWLTALAAGGLIVHGNTWRVRRRSSLTKARIDDARFQLRVVPTALVEAWRRPVRLLLRLLATIGLILACSLLPLIRNDLPGGLDLTAVGNLLYGCGIAVVAYALLMERFASVVLLCDSGMILDGRRIGWTAINGAKAFAKRPDVLCLRLRGADILVETPAEIRDDVAAYVNDQIAAADQRGEIRSPDCR